MNYLKLSIAIGTAATLFSGCATTELQTQTKMTSSIFLDPVKKSERSVFVSIKNTSGQDVGALEPRIISKLNAKGYRVVDDPEAAKYTLMTNVLFANNLKEAKAAGATSTGAVVGGVLGAVNSGGKDGLVGAVVGGLVVGGIGKLTEDEIFRMVTDVVVREKKSSKVLTTKNANDGQVSVGQEARAGFANSFAGPIRSDDAAGGAINSNQSTKTAQQYETDYVEHKTRVFSEAVKMSLKLDEAMPVMVEKMAEQISQIF